jgi:triacylglycerol lipase
MGILLPLAAAEIARAVYSVETAKDLRDELETKNPFALRDMFEFRQESVTRGKSGPTTPLRPNVLAESGFGYVARGTGAFVGDVLIALRGTNFVRGRDVWTDANIGIQKGPRGLPVHGGFNDTFRSLRAQLESEIKAVDSITNVHIVGHSLGGGLATLAADWCLRNKVGKVHLYTFGCPRVGTHEFVSALTEDVTASSIYRVHHTSDVVSMIPFFPFMHNPLPGIACTVSRGGLLGAPIAVSTHLMSTYIDDMEGKSWAQLRSPGAAALLIGQAEAALNQELLSKSGGQYSAKLLNAINTGISRLLESTGNTICMGAAGGMTVLDRLSFALNKVTQQGMETQVGQVLCLAMRFLGMPSFSFGKITLSVIRAVLHKLFSAVYGMARMAIATAGRG